MPQVARLPLRRRTGCLEGGPETLRRPYSTVLHRTHFRQHSDPARYKHGPPPDAAQITGPAAQSFAQQLSPITQVASLGPIPDTAHAPLRILHHQARFWAGTAYAAREAPDAPGTGAAGAVNELRNLRRWPKLRAALGNNDERSSYERELRAQAKAGVTAAAVGDRLAAPHGPARRCAARVTRAKEERHQMRSAQSSRQCRSGRTRSPPPATARGRTNDLEREAGLGISTA
jgi:hypothetical protein